MNVKVLNNSCFLFSLAGVSRDKTKRYNNIIVINIIAVLGIIEMHYTIVIQYSV